MKIRIVKHDPEAITPTYATDGSGAFDLYAIVPPSMEGEGLEVVNGKPVVVDTGIAFEVPPGHGLFILSRSGHGFNKDVRLANCVGLLDSDFRGTLRVKLTADVFGRMTVKHGDRVAQAVILPLPRVEFEEVAELSTTTRGMGGYGSTGA